jgi:hypothetical protein
MLKIFSSLVIVDPKSPHNQALLDVIIQQKEHSMFPKVWFETRNQI